MRTLTFRVTGMVQHVWFRGWTQMTARSLGLCGWVRNLPDGSVAGQAQMCPAGHSGDAALETFREALRQGPPSARVDTVEARLEDVSEHFEGFHVRR
jgi:Acylphosphatases